MKKLVKIALFAVSFSALADNPYDPYGNNARAQYELQQQQEIYQQRQVANEQQWQDRNERSRGGIDTSIYTQQRDYDQAGAFYRGYVNRTGQ